jgi:hypothetical protein
MTKQNKNKKDLHVDLEEHAVAEKLDHVHPWVPDENPNLRYCVSEGRGKIKNAE